MGSRFQHGLRLGAALATVLLLLASCGREHDLVTVPSTPTLGDPADLELSMYVRPTNAHPGDTLEVVIVACNPTTRAIPLPYVCPPFGVQDANGTSVGPQFACIAALESTIVPAGQCNTETFRWDGRNSKRELVAPGDYWVVGGRLPSEPTPVPITILPE
jgi:hypothetical protein